MTVSILSGINTGTATGINASPGNVNFNIAGHSPNIQTTEPPHLLWDRKLAYSFQTSAQSLEIVSDSVNDTSAGTGARTVLVETLNSAYVTQTQIVTLNGTTPVALTGTHLIVQSVLVLTSGSNFTNVGNLTVRVSGAGAIQGYIAAEIGIQRAFKYTVPAGKTLVIDNLYLNSTTPTGTTKTVTLDFIIRFENGTVAKTQTNYFSGNTTLSISLPTGFVVPEKSTIFAQITAVDANGGNFAMSGSGGLYSNT